MAGLQLEPCLKPAMIPNLNEKASRSYRLCYGRSPPFGTCLMYKFLPAAPVMFAVTLLMSASALQAAEVNVPAATGGADVTVYNSDLALVRERRDFRLPAASAQLAFSGVSARIQPETALLDIVKGDPVKVSEQAFSFDVITPERLLEQSVGQEVAIYNLNPATGKETVTPARVLSTAGGVVLDIGGKIHTTVPGRLVFNSLPQGLHATPTLLLNVTGPAGKDTEAEFSYLTGGLTWHADYVMQYDADAGRMDLTGWATVTNTTGVDFKDAKVKLVAGDINRVNPPRPMRMMEAKAMAAPAAAPPLLAPGVTEEALDTNHVYTMSHPTTLADKATKQLALMSAQGIAVRRELIVRNEQPYIYTNTVRGPIPDTKAEAELVFKNDASAKLGMPLPAGTVRVYGMDEQGAAQFIGEAAIDHTPTGNEVRVKLGREFDVPVTREQTNFVKASDTINISAWKISVKNAKSKPIKIRVIEPMPESWEITKENIPHKSSTAGSTEWLLDVPAKGQTVLEYNVKSVF